VLRWVGAAALTLAASCLMGCGSKVGPTVSREGSPNRQAGSMSLGATINETIARLGEPVSRSGEAGGEELNYGFWQLEFKSGQLVRKVRVRVPTPGGKSPVAHNASTEIQKLVPGVKNSAVRQSLGRPEEVYESWEGDGEEEVVLRYGEWELAFVDGVLVQRSR
jgi:hypothetical protein